MPVKVDDIRLLYVSGPGHLGWTEIPISNNKGRLVVSLPSSLRWIVRVEWNSDDKSTRMCRSEVDDDAGERVADGKLTLATEPISDIELSPFRVTVTGTYTVHVWFEDSRWPPMSVLVTDSW